FVLVDCVGVTETDKTETKSLETKPSVPTAKLMEQVARGDRHSETLRALGNRMIRLDLKLNDQQRKRVNELITTQTEDTLSRPGEGQGEGVESGLLPSTTLVAIASNLIHSTNEDKLIHAAQAETKKEEVSDVEIQKAFKPKADQLIKPFHNPDLRKLIEELRKNTDQLIDDSPDKLDKDGTGYDVEKAKGLISNWQQFIKDHQNELDAIQLIYKQPYQKRHLSYDMINQLVEAVEQPPYHIAPVEVWRAYEQLKKAKVRGAPPESKLPILISLIRLATGVTNVLEPFTELVNNRFENWLKQQALQRHSREGGNPVDIDNVFSKEQLGWLNKIRDQIAQNAEMTVEDFNYIPFNQKGGLLKARELFGKELEPLISELNGYLIA
ncbi:MAG: restriction endonuclease subunit R, partial [Gammaproteobacteria bacterium]